MRTQQKLRWSGTYTEKKFEVEISKGGETVDEEPTEFPFEGDDPVEEDENLALLSEAKQTNTTLKVRSSAESNPLSCHTVISLKTVTVQFCVYLEAERVENGHELNDYYAALASLTLKLGTWFIHFAGGGVIKGRFMDAVATD
jgi:hypothetical protein